MADSETPTVLDRPHRVRILRLLDDGPPRAVDEALLPNFEAALDYARGYHDQIREQDRDCASIVFNVTPEVP